MAHEFEIVHRTEVKAGCGACGHLRFRLAGSDSRGRKVACLQCGKVQSAEDAWEEPDTLVGLPTLLRRVVDREAA